MVKSSKVKVRLQNRYSSNSMKLGLRDHYFDAVTVTLVSAASVHRDVTLENTEAAAADGCPRWNCPCVGSQQRVLFFASKRQDSTSHFRRTVFYAAREALLHTQNVLRRIVSYSCVAHITL